MELTTNLGKIVITDPISGDSFNIEELSYYVAHPDTDIVLYSTARSWTIYYDKITSYNGSATIPAFATIVTDIGAAFNLTVTLSAGDIEIGAVEIKNDVDDTRVKVLANNAMKTDMSSIAGTVVATGAGAVSAGVQRVTAASDDPAVALLRTMPVVWGEVYASPQDFQAVYTSTASLTTSAAPFTIDDASCYVFKIVWKNLAGIWQSIVNTHNGISIAASAGVITVTGATPFVSTDTAYRVVVLGQEKGFDTNNNALQVLEQTRLLPTLDSIQDTTNLAAATYYYPTATGQVMDDNNRLGFSMKVIEGDAVLDTVELEITDDEDLTNADWIKSYWYSSKTNAMVNILSTLSTAGTYTELGEISNFSHYAYRFKVVVADATNTVIIKANRTKA